MKNDVERKDAYGKKLQKTNVAIVVVIVIVSVTLVLTTQSIDMRNNDYRMEMNPPYLLEEGFEGGVMPPTGWTHTVYNPSYTWKIISTFPHSGAYAAQCPKTSEKQDED